MGVFTTDHPGCGSGRKVKSTLCRRHIPCGRVRGFNRSEPRTPVGFHAEIRTVAKNEVSRPFLVVQIIAASYKLLPSQIAE